MKAIDTIYNGYRFRSRLEARWAVFFDTLGVKYEYEKEGFEFDGIRYLPDFWIPHLKLWVEIKAELSWIEHKRNSYIWHESKELVKCEKFKNAQEWPVACVVGTPGDEKIYFYAWDVTDSSGGSYDDDDSQWCFSNAIFTLDPNPGRTDRVFISDDLGGEVMEQFTYPRDYGRVREDLIKKAVVAARSARFEFGEHGAMQ
jgi:hypothetical protein